ncbi:hypothetical protein M3205_23375 [Cytobacillus firmus]|uniref:hypothetical protein n=1 Tax=Cytobacillus firmus TaxID=1399 RepID=UPI0020412BF5|nr:hypothetical protein [Cytobacillus firmus]MCM3708588.1 hypothetical protein [Cytobacillus firmus]
MKKLIVLLMALVLFFVPFGSAFAYTGGLLNGKPINRGVDANTSTQIFSTITDNDEGTPVSLQANGQQDTFWYEFSSPVNLTHYQLKAMSTVTGLKITAVTSTGQVFTISSSPNTAGGKVSTSVSNVKKIVLTNTATSPITVYEFDVFGSDANPSPSGTDVLANIPVNIGSALDDTLKTDSFLTDGNESTGYTLIGQNQMYWYKFDKPINVMGYKHFKYNGTTISWQLKLYDANKNVLYTSVEFPSQNLSMDVKNVSYFSIENTRSVGSGLYEFDLLGVESPTVTHDDVTNLILSATHNSVGLMWNLPTDKTDFIGTKIYKNGEFLKSVDSSTKTFTDSNVSADTNYTYKITAVYSDGHETEGISKSVTTKSTPPPDRDGDGIPDDEDEFPDDPTNVGEVKNLEITTTYKSANLSWVLPKSENLQHVNIYRETLTQETSFMDKLINGKTVYAAGEKIFETNGTYFNDYTVEPGTEYEYKVTTTSVDGVESEGVTARTKTPGKPLVAFEELSLPFSVKDLLLSGNGLLWIIGPFILLALAFLLVPKIRNLIIGAFRKDSKGSSEAAERRTKAEAIQKMERQEAKEFRTTKEPKSERVEVAPKPTREPKEIKQPRIREPKERIRTAKLTRERIREPRAPRASREPRAPRERARKPRDRRGIS